MHVNIAVKVLKHLKRLLAVLGEACHSSFSTLTTGDFPQKVSRRPNSKIGNLHLKKSTTPSTIDRTRLRSVILFRSFPGFLLIGLNKYFSRAPIETFGHIQCLLE